MHYSIKLHLAQVPELKLTSTSLSCPSGEVRCAELASPEIFDPSRTFTWCPSVRIATYLLVLAATKATCGDTAHPLLISSSSALTPLASALTGAGGALRPIFGCLNDSSRPLSASIFVPSNLRQRRPGPGAVTIDDSILPWDRIEIMVGDTLLSSRAQLRSLADRLSDIIGITGEEARPYP